MSKVKVLFLAANPSKDLRLDEEIRQITKKIRASEYRDSLELVHCLAARRDDLEEALLEHRPQILHFSGHGSPSDEIILTNTDSDPEPLSNAALVELLRILQDNLQLVVLNACYSRPQAQAITEFVDCAVGMNKAIGDEAAIAFAGSFYRAIGFAKSVQTAFELGKAALEHDQEKRAPDRGLSFGKAATDEISTERIPELLFRNGGDPNQVVVQAPSEGESSDSSTAVGGDASENLMVSGDRNKITQTTGGAQIGKVVGKVIIQESTSDPTQQPVDRVEPKDSEVAPRGLAPFDERDKGFFLKLLPGPYHDGLPESIEFWKHLIEEADADKTFHVGLIYGRSGCGKSSLVRAA